MPMFDYVCHDCELITERLVTISEMNHQRCDDCDQLVEKQLAAPMGYVRGTRTRVRYSQNKLNKDSDK